MALNCLFQAGADVGAVSRAGQRVGGEIVEAVADHRAATFRIRFQQVVGQHQAGIEQSLEVAPDHILELLKRHARERSTAASVAYWHTQQAIKQSRCKTLHSSLPTSSAANRTELKYLHS